MMRCRFLLPFLLLLPVACAAPPRVAPPAPSPSTALRQEVRSDLAAGRPLEALRKLTRAGQRGGAGDLTEEYKRAAGAVLEAAARHRRAGEHAEAGELLRQLLDHWPQNSQMATVLGRTEEEVRDDLRACADCLMENGLSAYRQGRLEEAVATWKRVLAIDPAHAAAGQALRTASVQLKNLRALE